MRNSSETWPETEERRLLPRADVHWTIYIFWGNGRPVQSRTKNLSSSGFYCFVEEPLVVGERLWCQIMVPSDSLSPAQGAVSLKCQARVQRVEPLETGLYGVAWVIEDYSVVRAKAAHVG